MSTTTVFGLFALALAWFAPLFLGGVLVLLGLRGKRVGRQASCRSCGYTLPNVGTRPGSCSECGASLLGAARVRLGHYEPRRRPLIVGSVLILVMTCIGGLTIRQYRNAPPVPLRTVKQRPAATPVTPRAVNSTSGVFDYSPRSRQSRARGLAGLAGPAEPEPPPPDPWMGSRQGALGLVLEGAAQGEKPSQWVMDEHRRQFGPGTDVGAAESSDR